MGAWSKGILQTDGAQDGLVEAAHWVEREVAGLDGREDAWPRLLAAVGLLVRFSPCSLDPANARRPNLAQAIERHRPVDAVLDGIHIDPARFERWRARWEQRKPCHASEAEFYAGYDASVAAALEYGRARFSA